MGLLATVGDILGTNHTDDAIAAQQAGANNANNTQMAMFNTIQAEQAPYREAGEAALQQMQNPDFQKTFTLNDFHEDPGYQFALQQGQQALERSASAKGMQLSGGQLKSLTNYNQGMADQQYQSAYERFNNDQSTRFNRLASLAGIGQTATGQSTNAAMNTGAGIAQTQMGLGNAIGAAQIAQGNQNSQLLNSGVGAAFLFCDRRLKTDIEPVSKADLDELKAHLRAYRFRYKDPEHHGKGDFIGVMAQDLQKSKLGKDLVFKDNFGNLQIDVNRVLMLFLASLAEA